MNRTKDTDEARIRTKGGLESRLEISAWVVLIVGLTGAAVALVSNSLFAAVLIGANAWIMWLVLEGLAEAVRLQKRSNGLPYSGEISRTEEIAIRRCASCGEIVEHAAICESCQQRVVGSGAAQPAKRIEQAQEGKAPDA